MTRRKRFSLFKFLFIVLVIALIFFLISNMFGNRPTETDTEVIDVPETQENNNEGKDGKQESSASYYVPTSTTYSTDWKLTSNNGNLNQNVASGVRPKRTQILGNNKDVMTILIYMCGSDLESEAAMGVYDLQEMSKANIASNVNVIVYTGGATKWHVSDISSKYNQIYRIAGNGRIERLVDNAGTGSMVDPNTLLSFIEWGQENYPANRFSLIFWDHGGGSVSGYGYDEKYPNLGSMDLAEIDSALTEADVDFDFIGFDACLMANTENALMLAEHADYLIASEETEPGVGWYYTDWLTALSNNVSMPTIEIGKNIADSFVRQCKIDTPRQSATLSVIDLAEMQDIIPAKLSAFAKSTNNIINASGYAEVADARGSAREFSRESYIDLVDLIDFANNIGTSEARDLVTALLSCVKYNTTSSDMSNAFGLSIYFPYRSSKYINTVLNTYNNIEMNSDYQDVVRSFASYATAGQVASGGSHNPYASFDSYYSDNYYGSQSSSDVIYDLLDLFASGSYSSNNSYSSYYGSALDLLFGRDNTRNIADYIANNHFDADLTFKDNKIKLTDKQWDLIDSVKLNTFIDDGSGYIELGKDNIFDIDEEGNLLGLEDMTWLAISTDNKNFQVMPYYYIYQIEDGDNLTSVGRVPVLLTPSGEVADSELEISEDSDNNVSNKYANLIITIDNDGKATLSGITYDYKDDSSVVAKNLKDLNKGDVIEFVCDYYDYDGNYTSSHKLGDPITYDGNLYIGDIDISSYNYKSTYELTDIYNQQYWTTPMK